MVIFKSKASAGEIIVCWLGGNLAHSASAAPYRKLKKCTRNHLPSVKYLKVERCSAGLSLNILGQKTKIKQNPNTE